MTTHAYQEIYLSKAQSLLGTAFDYAVNDCGILGDDFVKLFVTSSVSRHIEKGEASYIAGKSGIEIVRAIVFETKGELLEVEAKESYGRSEEYWIGWVIAYYQWYTNRKFIEILRAVSFADLQRIYHTLHEADITKVAEIIDERVKSFFPETNLKRFRKTYGCSQSKLSKLSGVSLRSIQMYEQRNKDINKASLETAYRLAKALGCEVEDLIER